MTWTTVGSGWKLNTPFSSVPYQLSGGIVPLTSKALSVSPGSQSASCRSWKPYASTPAATTTSIPPVQVKNLARLIRSAPR